MLPLRSLPVQRDSGEGLKAFERYDARCQVGNGCAALTAKRMAAMGLRDARPLKFGDSFRELGELDIRCGRRCRCGRRKRSKGVLIQCKSSTVEDKELGWEGVRDVAAGRASYAARYPGIIFSMVAITNRRCNPTARHQAEVLNVELIESDDFAEMLAFHPMKRRELERFFAGWGVV